VTEVLATQPIDTTIAKCYSLLIKFFLRNQLPLLNSIMTIFNRIGIVLRIQLVRLKGVRLVYDLICGIFNLIYCTYFIWQTEQF
jgi:hypothetical protein